jgi:hypothetical protein
MARCFYGLAKKSHLRDIVVEVCNVLGHGANACAVDLLLETAAQETHCGQLRDPTPHGAGRSIFQIDKETFYDVRARARASDVQMIIDNFGIDIRCCEWEHIDYSPLLAAIFAVCFIN